ncbi:branched-chain amino acid ABC transporter permease [Bradyrhizobium sp. U87765 SZCCT0131]|uniref:branched-chain amino acid ABC transporter permease n=1 Tax=unclassified Bradyrhizobium TaxID=2631580 RepID=UPI001BA8ECBC|nr:MULTISPECIES: branched-chain amino acid ABC transporter permease [unclassified Bradyrhizobium]MBR1221107.1 branched-chain amino acid ABC transporter permease [Bradyrhizobium sp. U87765 SZCCT0131]MBR1260073.1 branched-chain amino acid ABC transporter permease [Bradyrhizobium sp. U87765 SZCCT0134]MBR1307678.1 branched-chain amino acid ABC transporter permease [Bradyrhizobium sp. U87765 SZCCT0110]MBR1321632.1 branched-chain amino acid ABC transporter permease [Bradyrhizobium sp. U87765 SZCCT010
MDLVTFGVQLLNAVQYGMVLFLVASGLTLVFGILGVINLAHGAFYMLGAYLAYWIAAYSGSFLLALVGGVAIAFVLGLALEVVFVRRLYGRDHLAQVLLSFGLILMLDEVRLILFGKDVHAVAPPAMLAGAIQLTDNMSYPVYRLAICGFCLLVAAAIFLVIRYTKIGMVVRAGAENREMARVLGIPFDTVNRYVFAVGIALAALGGIVVSPISTVFPGMGDGMLILSFVVVVLGGIGSVAGAAIGALLIGLTDTFGKVFFPSISSILIYLLMAVVLLWRPNGILGRREV